MLSSQYSKIYFLFLTRNQLKKKWTLYLTLYLFLIINCIENPSRWVAKCEFPVCFHDEAFILSHVSRCKHQWFHISRRRKLPIIDVTMLFYSIFFKSKIKDGTREGAFIFCQKYKCKRRRNICMCMIWFYMKYVYSTYA